MTEYIMKEEMDMNGVDCYIRKGKLIRCGECIHAQEYPTVAGLYIHCWKLGTNSLTHTFYCGFGERKEE